MDHHLAHAPDVYACPLPPGRWYVHRHPHAHPPGRWGHEHARPHQHPPDVDHRHVHARGVDPLDDHDHHHLAADDLQPPGSAAEQRSTPAPTERAADLAAA